MVICKPYDNYPESQFLLSCSSLRTWYYLRTSSLIVLTKSHRISCYVLHAGFHAQLLITGPFTTLVLLSILKVHTMGALSKGCASCKRRKVKCDETRPKCTRCRNAGIECAGFATRLRFVDEMPRIRRSIAVSHAQSHEFSAITRNSQLAFHSSRIRQSQPLDSSASFLAKQLPLTAFKDDIFMSYLVPKLFGEYGHPSNAAGEIRCGLPIDWICELVRTPEKPRYKSWDALAAVIFGQAHNSYEVIANALKLYGQALAELRNQLSNPYDRRTDSTLASITALYMYEVSNIVVIVYNGTNSTDACFQDGEWLDVARKRP